MESSVFSFSVGLNCLGNLWPSLEAILSETFRRRQAPKNYCWNSSSLSDLEAFGNAYVFMYKRKWIFSFLEISHLSRSINGMYHFGLHTQTLTLPVCYPHSLSAERGRKADSRICSSILHLLSGEFYLWVGGRYLKVKQLAFPSHFLPLSLRTWLQSTTESPHNPSIEPQTQASSRSSQSRELCVRKLFHLV